MSPNNMSIHLLCIYLSESGHMTKMLDSLDFITPAMRSMIGRFFAL